MSFHDYLRIIRQGWWLIVATTLFGAIVGLASSLLQAPTYQAKSTVFITVTGTDDASSRQAGNAFVVQRAPAYADLATTARVLAEARKELPGVSLEDLQRTMTSTVRTETNVVDIVGTSGSAELAAQKANAVAQALATTISQLEDPGVTSDARVRADIVESAQAPSIAVTPQPRNYLLAGILVGLLVGLAIVVVGKTTSSRLRSSRDIALASGLPAISIPQGLWNPRRMRVTAGRQEAIRALRESLRFQIGAAGALTITSVERTADVATLAAELAAAFGEIGSRVLLVWADTGASRRTVASLGRDVDGPGLAEVLRGVVDLDDAVRTDDARNISVLTSGNPGDMSNAFSGEAMSRFLRSAATKYDYTLLVTPPMLDRSEAAVLASQAQTTVLLLAAGVTRRGPLLLSLERLSAVGGRSVNLVLDGVRRGDMQPAGISMDGSVRTHERVVSPL